MASASLVRGDCGSTRNAAESDSTDVKSSIGDTLFAPVNGTNAGYRVAPLTQAELDRLRPFLSFLVPGQGRSGLIDLGTIVATAPAINDLTGVTTDELSPKLMNVGDSLRPNNSSRVRTQANPGRRDITNRWASVNDALAMDAPPALNINTVPGSSGMVRLYSDVAPSGSPATIPGWPADPTTSPITSIAGIGRLRWLDPHTGDGTNLFARPPLGILGFGIVAIEGAATARDPQGNAVAQRRRRTVVQAVPQERPIEAAWRTQGEMEALILARHGSWIQSGPHPTRRIANWGETAGDMAALDCAGWIEPAPVCSFGTNVAIQFDWRVPFGLTGAKPWADVLKDEAAVSPAVSPAQVKPTGLVVGAMTAQGLRLKAPDELAYTIAAATGPVHLSVMGDQMAARQFSMRFTLPTIPASGLVALVEARAFEPGLAAGPLAIDPTTKLPQANFGVPTQHTDNQSVWRIHYDVSNQMLVMVIANAALPWDDAARARFGCTGWTTGSDVSDAAIDARCDVGALPFAPSWQAQRVEFRYKVAGGLQPRQWYHLQSFCASDRPGLHGLILDGVVGRDATRPGIDMMKRTGDHYTWPSMRLNMPAGLPGTSTATGNAHLNLPSITVTVPPKPDGSAYAVNDMLPPRGIVRIDDEFLSYDTATGTTLSGIQRARRVNTDQTSNRTIPDPLNPTATMDVPTESRWPITQAHADGALVTPGWSQVEFSSGRWLRGGVRLLAPASDLTAGLAASPQAAKVTGLTADPSNPGAYFFGQPASVTIAPYPQDLTLPWPLSTSAWPLDGLGGSRLRRILRCRYDEGVCCQDRSSLFHAPWQWSDTESGLDQYATSGSADRRWRSMEHDRRRNGLRCSDQHGGSGHYRRYRQPPAFR